jgi:cytochrome c oxidase subunit 3
MAHASVTAPALEQRASRVLFGTILFLASELLLFGGLFAAYFGLRSQTTPWPPAGVELSLPLGLLGTALLLTSSLTFHLGVRAAGRGTTRSLKGWILGTMALGIVFIGVELYDWITLDFSVSTHAYGTLYYTMTGIHGLHVLAGIGLMAVALARLAQGAYRSGNIDGMHGIAYYWHFVDGVWVALFLTLIVLR